MAYAFEMNKRITCKYMSTAQSSESAISSVCILYRHRNTFTCASTILTTNNQKLTRGLDKNNEYCRNVAVHNGLQFENGSSHGIAFQFTGNMTA